MERPVIALKGAFTPSALDQTAVSGIDIAEYRPNDAWHDWFVGQLEDLDPWDHVVGSRHSGGSGNFTCTECSYDSHGAVHPLFSDIQSLMDSTARPVLYTDRWREDYGRGSFNSANIRAIMWHCALAGGAGMTIGGARAELRLDDYDTDLDSPAQFRAFAEFWRNDVPRWPNFASCASKVSDGLCTGIDGEEYVVYLGQGGGIDVDLAGASVPISVRWYNPRTGESTPAAAIEVASSTHVVAPDNNDWVLHLGQLPPDTTPPAPPTELVVN